MPRIAAALYLGGLAVAFVTAWQVPEAGAANGSANDLHALQLILLLFVGAVIAVLTLARADGRAQVCGGDDSGQGDGLGELMAHMSHMLRTPLNAVIGFSEVMARELHGPLGNSRYQEYAHHICESGGRLLKSSEATLALAETMTALMTDRTRGRRERVPIETLVGEAWRALSPDGDASGFALVGEHAAVTCERRATIQAIAHLVSEAMDRAGGGGGVEIAGRRNGLEIHAQTMGWEPRPEQGDLRVIVARLLLQAQGATLRCEQGAHGWSAAIAFAN